MTPPDKAMPLSASEREQFDGIRMSLEVADPTTAKSSITALRRHSTAVAGALFMLGIIALLAGIVETQIVLTAGVIVSVAGFVVMVWAVTRFPQVKSAGRRHQ